MNIFKLSVATITLVSLSLLSACSTTTTPTDNNNNTTTAPTGIIDLVTSDLSFKITTLDLVTSTATSNLDGQAPERTSDGTIIYIDDNNNLVESAPNGSAKKVIVKMEPLVPVDDRHDDFFNNPRLSRDGKYVAYEGYGGGLYVVNRTTGAVVASWEFLLSPFGSYTSPSWTSDGKLIVTGGSVNPGVYLLNVSTKTSTPIGSGLTKPTMSNVSSDGQKICFVMSKTVYTMNIDGSSMKKLSDSITNTYFPKWSPDSKWIAVLANNSLLLVPTATGAIIDEKKNIPGVLFDNTSTQISWK